MPIRVDEDINGRLILNLSTEETLTNNPRFNDLILAFSVVSRTRDTIIVETGNQIVDSLDFLIRGIESLNVQVELSHDLASLMERYRAELDQIANIRQSESAASFLDDAGAPPEIPGLNASAQLLPHQRRGLQLALRDQNLAEFSVQGAGKTAVVLSTFAIWRARGEVRHLLVIGPVSCFQPWRDEVARCFGDTMRTIQWSGSLSTRMRLVPEFHRTDIILCSYDTARRDIMMLRQLVRSSPTLLVLDESHYIKNFSVGARATAVFTLAPYATRRMVLTGTPVPHSLLDLWTQFNFLWPSGSRVLLGTPQQYQELLTQATRPAQELRARLGPYFHRTNQDELQLPPANTHFVRIQPTEIPPEQTRVIRLLELRVLAEARLQLSSVVDRDVLAQWQRARIIRLLQAVSNPGLLLNRPEWSVDQAQDLEMSDLLASIRLFQSGTLMSAKISWVVNKVRQLVSTGEKVVIWTWWVENIRLLERLFSDLNPLLLYGAIKPYEEVTDDEQEQSREKNIRLFRTRADRSVLIANPSACAEAISLHRECHNAIYVDRTYNCGQFLQSLNRIHRVGLPENVTTHYWIPIIDCAVERSVDNRLQIRQQVMYEFLGDQTPALGLDVIWDSDIADNEEELNLDFQDLTQEIASGSQ